MSRQILEVRNISKEFPGTLALDQVSVSFHAGQVHALLGKNGSGKSTLMKIISGVHLPTSGEICLDGEKIHLGSVSEALSNGIATVYQELSVISDLTVGENLLVGKLPMKNKIRIDWKETQKQAREALERLNVDLDINEYVRDLKVGEQQLVEIAKAMAANPGVLILDEPTSALSDAECEKLFAVIEDLKRKGLIILFISHRLQEIFRIADYVTVLRDGRLVGTEPVKGLDPEHLVHMMFGEVEHHVKEDSYVRDEAVLEAKGLESEKIHNVSFTLKKGEVLGIAGMMGAGRTELLRAVYGLDQISAGTVKIHGKEVRNPKPHLMKKYGMGYASENRQREGLCLGLSIGENLMLANYELVSSHGKIDFNKVEEFISRQIKGLQIKLNDHKDPVTSLSGGNQQKVVVGDWLNTEPSILLLDEPSRGIDVQAKQQIFQVVWDIAKKGVSTVMVSSELDELLEVCDRILIMVGGRVVGEYTPDELTLEKIYSLAMHMTSKQRNTSGQGAGSE